MEQCVGWYDQDDVYLVVSAYRGGVYLVQTYDEPTPSGRLLWVVNRISDGDPLPAGAPKNRLFPFSYYRGKDHPARLWGVSHWFLLFLTAALPLVQGIRLYRKRRIAMEGLCPTCGYDLRATPDRCPECGRAVTKA